VQCIPKLQTSEVLKERFPKDLGIIIQNVEQTKESIIANR